ncbi:choice-of-anchor J domain-containing protein [Thermophagus xiamenensis]|uniref:DUF5017 domain-containing protein n=1 Tax=Thermophagus xiamenensis TaxID=385682 RepID=A0A1I2EG93_9BACT|nr:choice-of-anchor J domain-containing protein [Thermophagus xiamenensis]SFE91270.1 hypothetical protein SAMN05444380_12249 [Thermophagus xiamenensis]
MKKLIYILTFASLFFWGCDPLEDVYNELDQEKGDYSAEIEVVLEEADYSSLADIAEALGNSDAADFIDEFLAFSEEYPASEFIPAYLEDEYIALKGGSRATVTFNYMVSAPDYLDDYTLTYELDSADYADSDEALKNLKAFSPAYPVENYMSGILNRAFEDKPDGSVVYTSFRVSDIDPDDVGSESAEILREDFNGSLGVFTAFSIVGDEEWTDRSYGGTEYAFMSGYVGGEGNKENEDWLVSPAVDLSDYKTAYVVVNQAVNFLDSWDHIQLMVSTDFDGTDIESANWDELTINTKPDGDSWTFVESEEVDLSEYVGQTIHLAFRFRSTDSGSASWEIDWIEVGTNDVRSPEFTYHDEFFEKDGDTWTMITEDDFEDNKYILSAEDYDAMGDPGKYNNFDDDLDPDLYLPQFIALNKPFAQVDDKVVVVYMYYDGGTFPKASEYVFNGTEWVNSAQIVERSEQFVHNGQHWVFDPTIVFTMTSADYQMIVDYVETNIDNGSDYINNYGTGEYYYGADAYYENFDLRISNRIEYGVPGFEGLSTEDAIALTYERLAEAVEVLLKVKYPDAVPQVNGVDVFYVVTLETYENDLSRGNYTYTFQCVSDQPEFELIEGPDFGE